ncbi:acyl carrier protein-like protein [Chytriomyces sp. MP71]|nr:acyl carrier protein-like protein [Chytriomyces sp. MP71]
MLEWACSVQPADSDPFFSPCFLVSRGSVAIHSDDSVTLTLDRTVARHRRVFVAREQQGKRANGPRNCTKMLALRALRSTVGVSSLTRRTGIRALSALPRVSASSVLALPGTRAAAAPVARSHWTTQAVRAYGGSAAALSIETVQERVLNVLKDFDKVDASKLTLDSHFITDLGLDSLDQVEITIAIEEEFNIELSDRDADDILTPRAAAEKVFANKHAM